MMGVGCAIALAFAHTRAADVSENETEPPVAAVQALLRQERLYSGPVNGVEDRETVAAIRRYQILHGLRATGRLETDTLRSMLLPAPPPPGELTTADRELLRELAQAPLPDAVAERRKPIPPGEPPSATPTPKPDGKAHKSSRSKANRQHRSGTNRLSAD